ncbi:NUDIX hydrolase [Aliiroseovarius sp. PTFE2010]|uniref:NUDIX hydrolase n=1 Tax=Aliiroseovarius sp. PTFE2010 TaxID=3417190 RepID=UPI003CF58D26
MNEILKKVWESYLSPMVRRPSARQVAALCYRDKNGKREVLLVTSRGTGRWILPKGWHEDGLSAAASAELEAWEEAGVKRGHIASEPLGSFGYHKVLDDGLPLPVEADVFPLEVRKVADDFPEAKERKRKWVEIDRAVDMVREPGLKRLLREIQD